MTGLPFLRVSIFIKNCFSPTVMNRYGYVRAQWSLNSLERERIISGSAWRWEQPCHWPWTEIVMYYRTLGTLLLLPWGMFVFLFTPHNRAGTELAVSILSG